MVLVNIEFAGDTFSCRIIQRPSQYKPGDIVIWDGQFQRIATVQTVPYIENLNYSRRILIVESATGRESLVREFDGMVWRPNRIYRRK